MLLSRALVAIALTSPGLLLASEQNIVSTSLPEIKATVRGYSNYDGALQDIELPASALQAQKQQRVIEGNLPVHIYVRETPNQPRPTIEVNVIDTRTNQSLPGFPAHQDVGPLGMLSFNISIAADDMRTLVRNSKKSVEEIVGEVWSISLHVDIRIPVKPEKNADGNPVLDCDDLLRQDVLVLVDIAQKLNVDYEVVGNAYKVCLDKQTDTLMSRLKPDDQKIIERVRQLLPDLQPVCLDAMVNRERDDLYVIQGLIKPLYEVKPLETVNRLARQLSLSDVPNAEARKTSQAAFAFCQTKLEKLVNNPKNARDETEAALMKKNFQSDLAKAHAALKELEEIAAMLPDNAAMLLALSSVAATLPHSFEAE
jgi:hypothetical protein